MRAEQVRDIGKILFLDIETVPQHWKWDDLDPVTARLFNDKTRWEQERTERSVQQIYADRAGILAEFGKIICIGAAYISADREGPRMRVTSFQGDDEQLLLQQFTDLLHQHYHTDEHWLCGHNIKEFDLPYIARRCIVQRVRLPRLLDNSGSKPWEVGHIDTMSLWCFGDRKAFTSLSLLAHILGVPTPKDDISGADVARVYHVDRDLDRISMYCRKDVIATAQVYLRLTGREPIPSEHIITI